MALDNIMAVFCFPLFGSLSDRSNAKIGRRTPYVIVGTVIAAFAFMGLAYADFVQTEKIKMTILLNHIMMWLSNLLNMKKKKRIGLSSLTICVMKKQGIV